MLLEGLSEDTGAFYSKIKRMKRPSALEFMRECVSAHQPCIIEGLLEGEWDCLRKWSTTEGFLSRAPPTVDVNITPSGRADSVNESSGRFVTPLEMTLSTETFMDMLERPSEEDAIPYLSSQNDNLRQKMPQLLEDCGLSIDIADECFAGSPEAINLWVGDGRSVSSLHKDFYENMYCVVRGTKTFILLPPTDIAFLPSRTLPTSTYIYDSQGEPAAHTSVRPQKRQLHEVPAADSEPVPWICLDPDDPEAYLKHPDFHHASPMRVEVHAGEMLYLPAMWLHQVGQVGVTVAVNFWYDMRFDLRYCFMRAAQRMVEASLSTTDTGKAHALLNTPLESPVDSGADTGALVSTSRERKQENGKMPPRTSKTACSAGASRSVKRQRRRRDGGVRKDNAKVWLSKALSAQLRHQGIKSGLNFTADGYTELQPLLQVLQRPGHPAVTLERVHEVVNTNEKKRFTLIQRPKVYDPYTKEGHGELVWVVRANQGHSLTTEDGEAVCDDTLLLTKLSAEDLPECFHGTYKAAVADILASGLNAMGRQHIHFVRESPDVTGGSLVRAGMRSNIEVLIRVDVPRAVAAGITFSEASNGVILSNGLRGLGVIPPEYLSVCEICSK
eukprot:GSChrysophyteH1.ASY1.ANO1.309.1 assembled CDS